MKLKINLRKKKETPEFTAEDLRGVSLKLSAEIPGGYREVEHYWLDIPFAAAQILMDSRGHFYFYALLEPDLADEEREIFRNLKERVLERVALRASEDDRKSLFETFKEIVLTEYKLSLETIAKLWYYLERDCIYAGRITPLLKDHFIEDISCSGYGKPVFVYHSQYESIPTSIVMEKDELDDFVMTVVQRKGVEISMANPIADTTLYDGSRVQLTFRSEVTDHGSTFTIRKVKKVPVTPVDLVRWNSFSAEEMALLWLCLQSNGSMLFVGGTAAGKTTAMNATALFIPYHSKVVSIEDTREVMLPHRNWIPSVATDRIDMFALLKAALRQRPEYIIVGEVRGREVEIMFQAMALGHTCLSTFHGSNAEAVINRLMSPPYSVPRAMILNLDLVVVVGSFRREDRIVRRCSGIWLVGSDERGEEKGTSLEGTGLSLTPLFRWDGLRDLHRKMDISGLIRRLSERTGRSQEDLLRDLKRRARLIRELAEEGADYRRFFERIHLGRREENAEGHVESAVGVAVMAAVGSERTEGTKAGAGVGTEVSAGAGMGTEDFAEEISAPIAGRRGAEEGVEGVKEVAEEGAEVGVGVGVGVRVGVGVGVEAEMKDSEEGVEEVAESVESVDVESMERMECEELWEVTERKTEKESEVTEKMVEKKEKEKVEEVEEREEGEVEEESKGRRDKSAAAAEERLTVRSEEVEERDEDFEELLKGDEELAEIAEVEEILERIQTVEKYAEQTGFAEEERAETRAFTENRSAEEGEGVEELER